MTKDDSMKNRILKGLYAISREGFKSEPVNVVIDQEKCLRAKGHKCGKCDDACPKVPYGGYLSIDDPRALHRCIKCQACVAVCPEQAITVGDLLQPPPVGPIPSPELMLNLHRSRRSVRKYKDKPVSDEDCARMLEAAKWPPRGHNPGPFEITVVNSPRNLQRTSEICMQVSQAISSTINVPGAESLYRKLLGKHTYEVFSGFAENLEGQMKRFDTALDPMTFRAPGIVFLSGPSDELMVPIEMGMLMYAILLQAATLKLGTCCFGWGIVAAQRNKELKSILKIKEKNIVWGSIIFGYPAHTRPFGVIREDPDIKFV